MGAVGASCGAARAAVVAYRYAGACGAAWRGAVENRDSGQKGGARQREAAQSKACELAFALAGGAKAFVRTNWRMASATPARQSGNFLFATSLKKKTVLF